MGTINREDILTKRTHVYSFIQRKGSPRYSLELFSLHGAMGGAEEPLGEPEPRYRKSVTRRGAWDRVGEIESPPDAPTTSFTELMPRATATLLEQLKKSGEPFAVHTVIHQNADPQNYTRWESKEVFDGVRLTSFTRNDAEGDEDDLVQIEADAQFAAFDRVFPITFGEKAGTDITKEVVAVAVYPEDDRGDPSTKEIYAITKVDTTEPKLVYSTNGGATFTAESLTVIGTDEPDDIAVVGDYVIVTSSAGEAYYFAKKDDLANAGWSKVTGGIQAGSGPTAIYAPAVGSIYFAGLGGHVYKLTIPGRDVSALEAGDLTAQNLAAIHGAGDTLVAVGADNAVLVSSNAGRTWSSPTGPAAGVALNAVHVWDKDTFWIGGDGLYFTGDRGASWLAVNLGMTVASVRAVRFARDLKGVGYVGVVTATPTAHVLRTTDYGAEWETFSVGGFNTANEGIGALAVGGPNYVVAGGVVTAVGEDGYLALATA